MRNGRKKAIQDLLTEKQDLKLKRNKLNKKRSFIVAN